MTETKNINEITKRLRVIIKAIKKDDLEKANNLFDDLEESGLLTEKIFETYFQLSVLLQFTESLLWDSGAKILGGVTTDSLDVEYDELMEEIEEVERTKNIILVG